MSKRVFVSSTFVDLAEYRQSVQAAIRQLGAVDVSMEHFGARDERPLDECLRMITEESDVFVGIYAHRYGFVPPGNTTSVTEAEYNAASAVRLPRLIYLVEDSTPWVPAYIDQGEVRDRMNTLKHNLKLTRICAFFSNKDQLAAKVAADLGRHFAERETPDTTAIVSAALPPERQAYLLNDLRSKDKARVERSIQALTHLGKPWVVSALREIVQSDETDLAQEAIKALHTMKGLGPAEAIALGLKSRFQAVRFWSAFALGEMALFGKRKHAAAFLDSLSDALSNPVEECGTLDEIVHSIGKIGGNKAFAVLTRVLKSESFPASIKAKALHGPGRFWSSNPSLLDRFNEYAQLVIEQWPIDVCRDIASTQTFQYIREPLHSILLKRCDDFEPAP
jgi:hypothetical protein